MMFWTEVRRFCLIHRRRFAALFEIGLSMIKARLWSSWLRCPQFGQILFRPIIRRSLGSRSIMAGGLGSRCLSWSFRR